MEGNLLLEDLKELSNILRRSYPNEGNQDLNDLPKKKYGYGKGTADAFKLCGMNRLCDIVDNYDDILSKLEMSTIVISARQIYLCKQCVKEVNTNRTSDVLRLIEKSRIGMSIQK